MAAVFLNLFLRRVFLTGAPAFFCWKSWRGKGRGKPSSPGELEGKQGKLRGHREQGKLRGMEWMGTLGNSAGTESIRNFGMTDD